MLRSSPRLAPHPQPYLSPTHGDALDDNITLARAPPHPSHKSPVRRKWSPLVHTIAEGNEPFSYTALPAKLFDDEGHRTQQSEPSDSFETRNNSSGDYGAHGLLQPSLEPNGSKRLNHVEEEHAITMDVLLSAIRRLTAHEFGRPCKLPPYPAVLEPLYQRLSDYHVCLRSARKRAGASPARPTSMHASPMALDNTNTMHPDALRTSHAAPSDLDDLCQPQLPSSDPQASLREQAFQDQITDLETQLLQSRKAHHNLLRDHILSLAAATSASPTAATPALTTSVDVSSLVTSANLSRSDASAICNILGSVHCAVSSNGSSACDSANAMEEPALAQSQLTLQEALHIAKDKFPLFQGKQLKQSPAMVLVAVSDSNASLITLKDHPTLLNDATTRLLRAETELGLLKLVMAQNQQEISGLEDEVFKKQTELIQHRQIFESVLQLDRVGLQTQIGEDQVQIKKLQSLLAQAGHEKEMAVVATVKRLETEIDLLKAQLVEKQEEQQTRESQLSTRVQELEATVTRLHQELSLQAIQIEKMEHLSIQAQEGSQRDQEELAQATAKLQKSLDSDGAMVEHLEKEHKKRATALRSNLVQVQKTNKRLDKELSTLALKIVRVETLNDELGEQAERDHEEIRNLRSQAEALQAQLASRAKDFAKSSSSSALSPKFLDDEAQGTLRQQITALEVQVEELSNSLRLKEIELEQAHDETERLTLQLETDLTLQKQAHDEEMERFAAEKKLQAQRERTCQTASVTLFQNMVSKLQVELSETQEKLRDTTHCWGHTKEQLQKCEQSYRRRKRDLEETTKHLHEVEETVFKLGDAIGMLETEKEANLTLARALEERDRQLKTMEHRLKVLEAEQE